PVPLLPDVPLTLDTLTLIAPYSLTLALVGLMESLMTAKVVATLTETPSDHAREARGQGLANMLVGFFGGMAGCAMIGQTMINVKSGARTRISTFLAGTFLIVLCVALGDIVGMIPMAALVAVMIFVSIVTFDWRSISPGTVKKLPWTETLVMVITVVVVVATSNLALGVIVGVIVSMVLFTRKAAMQADVTSVLDPEGGTRVYSVTGEVFFASTNELVDRFDYAEQGLTKVVIDMSGSHVWDSSAVTALDQVSEHFRRRDIQVEIVGLNEPSAHLHEELSRTSVVRLWSDPTACEYTWGPAGHPCTSQPGGNPGTLWRAPGRAGPRRRRREERSAPGRHLSHCPQGLVFLRAGAGLARGPVGDGQGSDDPQGRWHQCGQDPDEPCESAQGPLVPPAPRQLQAASQPFGQGPHGDQTGIACGQGREGPPQHRGYPVEGFCRFAQFRHHVVDR